MASTQQLDNLIDALAKLVNLAVAVEDGNYLALFQITGVLVDIQQFNFTELKAEVAAFTDAEKTALEQAFLAKVSVSNPAVAAAIQNAVGILDGIIAVVEQEFKSYGGVLALITQIKALLGIK